MKFKTGFEEDNTKKFHVSTPSITDPYQYTPTSILFARSMEQGAISKIAKMNEYLYGENEDLESDEVTPLDVYPPDIADAYQSVRFYRGKIKEAERVYRESIKTTQNSSESVSQSTEGNN